MNKQDIERELDMIYYRLRVANQMSKRERAVYDKASRYRYYFTEDYKPTLNQTVEAVFLTQELFLTDIPNKRMRKRVNEAIGKAYSAMSFLGVKSFADLIGVNYDRVARAYENKCALDRISKRA